MRCQVSPASLNALPKSVVGDVGALADVALFDQLGHDGSQVCGLLASQSDGPVDRRLGKLAPLGPALDVESVAASVGAVGFEPAGQIESGFGRIAMRFGDRSLEGNRAFGEGQYLRHLFWRDGSQVEFFRQGALPLERTTNHI